MNDREAARYDRMLAATEADAAANATTPERKALHLRRAKLYIHLAESHEGKGPVPAGAEDAADDATR